MNHPNFPRMFEPLRIGNLELKNRLVMAPMLTRYFAEGGGVSQRLVDYYVERARGGVGLIIPECSYPCGEGYPGRLASNHDRFIPGMRRLADAVHEAGAGIVQQLSPGRGERSNEGIDSASVAGLSTRAIGEMVSQFGEGARRYREAGFDGMQVHGAHGYLVSNFLSRLTNDRKDDYGGDIANRAMFLLQIIKEVKKQAGRDFPVMVRLSLIDRMGYLTLEEGVEVCRLAEEAGADALDITSGMGKAMEWAVSPQSIPKGANIPLAAAVKQAVRIPVGVVGGIHDPSLAESVLAEGKADFILMGRALITDPQFAVKVARGRLDDIRSCIRCMHCGDAVVSQALPLTCTVNPECGRESYFREKLAGKAATPKKVLVVGGGCAGMEAARIAATRGHRVTVWEAGDRLGGRLNIASLPPFKDELQTITPFYRHCLDDLGVAIELRKEAGAEQIAGAGFDTVIVSCGGLPISTDIPGMGSNRVVTAEDVLLEKAPVGARVAVVGGGLVGCEVAEFLADRGRKVNVARRSERMADDVPADVRRLLLRRLREKGVGLYPGIRYNRISALGLEVVKDGKPLLLEADTIVIAAGYARNATLYDSLLMLGQEVRIAGDAARPGNIFTSITGGTEAALDI
ncbi:MAG: FAD-dependent oxidoreductase [Chloroflexota bacterium]